MTVRQQSITFAAEDIPVLNQALLVYLDQVSQPLDMDPKHEDWEKLMAMRQIQLQSIERLRADLGTALKEQQWQT